MAGRGGRARYGTAGSIAGKLENGGMQPGAEFWHCGKRLSGGSDLALEAPPDVARSQLQRVLAAER
jgi:hypothetical protein